jgi:hypothetical protein
MFSYGVSYCFSMFSYVFCFPMVFLWHPSVVQSVFHRGFPTQDVTHLKFLVLDEADDLQKKDDRKDARSRLAAEGPEAMV